MVIVSMTLTLSGQILFLLPLSVIIQECFKQWPTINDLPQHCSHAQPSREGNLVAPGIQQLESSMIHHKEWQKK